MLGDDGGIRKHYPAIAFLCDTRPLIHLSMRAIWIDKMMTEAQLPTKKGTRAELLS